MTNRLEGLTPTQYLIMSTLVARYRLGEVIWTFPKEVRKQIEELSSLGLVVSMSGMVEGTVRASLTEGAVKEWISPSYTAPVFRKLALLAEESSSVPSKKIRKVLNK